LELGEVEFRTNRRVYIKSVTPGSIAERLGIKKDWVVVAINGSVRLENQWRRFIGTPPSLFDAMFLPHAFALL
jgi:sulfur carrier protein ThiS